MPVTFAWEVDISIVLMLLTGEVKVEIWGNLQRHNEYAEFCKKSVRLIS